MNMKRRKRDPGGSQRDISQAQVMRAVMDMRVAMKEIRKGRSKATKGTGLMIPVQNLVRLILQVMTMIRESREVM